MNNLKFIMVFLLVICNGYIFKLSDLEINNYENIVAVNSSISSITLDKKNLSMKVGESDKLSITVTPSSASNEVIWISNNKSVVTVDNKGNVKAVGVGSAFILVVAKRNYSVKSICEVNVSNNNLSSNSVINITKIDLNKSSMTINKGSNGNLRYTITPNNATNKSLIWISSNPSVISIDRNSGFVKAVSKGTSVVTVMSANNNNIKDSCTITVIDSEIAVKDINVNKKEVNLYYGQSSNIKASVVPSNATNKSLTYSSSDPSKVSVDKNGHITIKNFATGNKPVNVTVKSSNNIVKTVKINIYDSLVYLGTKKYSSRFSILNREKNPFNVAEGFCIANDYYIFSKIGTNKYSNSGKIYVKAADGNTFKTFLFKNGILGHSNGMTYDNNGKRVIIIPDEGTKYKYISYNRLSKNNDLVAKEVGTGNFVTDKNNYIATGISYDRSSGKFYVLFSKKISTDNYEGYINLYDSSLKKLPGGFWLLGRNDTPKKVSYYVTQDIGSYDGKILSPRFYRKVRNVQFIVDGKKKKIKMRNGIDVYRGSDGEYLGTYILDTNGLGELESIDYDYRNNNFVAYINYGGGQDLAWKLNLNIPN